jgi:hypothetical protein
MDLNGRIRNISILIFNPNCTVPTSFCVDLSKTVVAHLVHQAVEEGGTALYIIDKTMSVKLGLRSKSYFLKEVFQIRIGFSVDLTFYLNMDPDLDPDRGSQTNTRIMQIRTLVRLYCHKKLDLDIKNILDVGICHKT